MSIDAIAIMYCLIVSQSLAKDGKGPKKRVHNRYKGMSPTELSCEDRNLHRDLVWQAPLKIKQGWKLTGYTAERCVPSYCSYQTVGCFRDSAGKNSAIATLNGTRCLMSPADLLPWEIYMYKVTAIYRRLTNQTRKLTRFARVTCEPVDRQMKLDAPYFNWIQVTTTAISFLFKPPRDLTNSIKASNNYDLRITFSFCLYESGKTCQIKDLRNDSCNPSSTYSNLKEGTKYTISAWYTTRASGKRITSATANKEVQTKIDYFPPKSQILLVVALSVFFILTIVALVIWRTTRSIRHKWEALVHKEIPRYFEEVLKDLSKANDGFITHDDQSQLQSADKKIFHDEKVNVGKLKVPIKPFLWGKHFESDKIRI